MVTSCCSSLSSRSASSAGEPIMNLPAGMYASFMPMELVMPLGGASPAALSAAGGSAANRLPKANAAAPISIATVTVFMLIPPPGQVPAGQLPRPEADHERQGKPGDDHGGARPDAPDVNHIERPRQ